MKIEDLPSDEELVSLIDRQDTLHATLTRVVQDLSWNSYDAGMLIPRDWADLGDRTNEESSV